ncbi:hypothetical protein HID58_033834 [Brassica napus]|uniref:F-box associated domain-containing protein n=1 Tax=Brassica napus TaxID=3708 RepID=A0ABQ8C0H4_BRANA|nr:hypothetical protein HID58_033834 [Brassica napus]
MVRFVVCCISNRTPYRFLIHTWNVGAAKWVTEEVNKLAPSKFYGNNNIVFFDGYFWFPDQNRLGVYDPVARTWDTLYVPLPNLSPYLMWITEYQGNIYLVDSVSGRGQMRVIMFRLNRLRLVWEKKKICDGLSSFISDESNIMTYGLPRDMSDIVYVWDSHINPDHPVKYSLNTRSFCKRHDGYCVESSNTNEMLHYAAWIEPPQNSGNLTRLLHPTNLTSSRAVRYEMEEGSSLMAVLHKSRDFKHFIFLDKSGKCSRLEQPDRFSVSRCFNLHMLVGRITRRLLFSSCDMSRKSPSIADVP